MKKLNIFIFIFLTFYVYQNDAVSSGTSVTSISNFYYQAAILCPVIMCSGVLLSENAVATTASCVNNLLPEEVLIYLGSVRYYTGGLLKPVSTINIHSKFDKTTFDFNIAVLGINPPLTPNDMAPFGIIPIPRCTSLPPVGTSVTVSAYGAIAVDLTLPDTLQRAMLVMYSDTQCQSYKAKTLTASVFCAGDPKGNKDLCPADQGAPLVYNGAVCGIYSWGCSCGLSAPNPSSPVFSDFVFLKSWLNTAIAAA